MRTRYGLEPQVLGREVKSARVGLGEARMVFVAFYDFDCLVFRDFHYVMVLVQEFKQRPDLIGFLALLEANDVRFVRVPMDE